MNENANPKDDARVVWARGCEPPRSPIYPPNNEARRLVWTTNQVTDSHQKDDRTKVG